MLLLFLHFLQHGILFYLDQGPSLVFAKLKPEFLDILAFLLGGGIPYAVLRLFNCLTTRHGL